MELVLNENQYSILELKIAHAYTVNLICITLFVSGPLLICPVHLKRPWLCAAAQCTLSWGQRELKVPTILFQNYCLCSMQRKDSALLLCPTDGSLKPVSNTFNLPYRLVFAVASEDSIFFYDTQQTLPFGYVSNIHYHTLSDLSW